MYANSRSYTILAAEDSVMGAIVPVLGPRFSSAVFDVAVSV
jgi:small basic protein